MSVQCEQLSTRRADPQRRIASAYKVLPLGQCGRAAKLECGAVDEGFRLKLTGRIRACDDGQSRSKRLPIAQISRGFSGHLGPTFLPALQGRRSCTAGDTSATKSASCSIQPRSRPYLHPQGPPA